ncbi:MAG: GDYXXLXY domain-containing protein [Saprospiraceae bacterium]
MKNVLFLLFLALCGIQLFIPAQMAWSAKDVLTSGEIFKFKTIPVDPNDPFRGKYVTLRFEEARYTFDTLQWQEWQSYDTFYAYLYKDAQDFARISELSPSIPIDETPYFIVKKGYTTQYKDSVSVRLDFPFDRFFMEESKAPAAERIFRDASRDAQEQTYATVRIKNGDAVLEDVMVNEVSLRELAEEEVRNEVSKN